jgi:hypothetical protein
MEQPEPDHERIERLTKAIQWAILELWHAEAKRELIARSQVQRETLLALLFALAEHILNIECHDCRVGRTGRYRPAATAKPRR